MGFKLGPKSKKKLVGVHPDLVKVIERAIELTTVDFTITEGVRSIERQKEYVASGASTTMDSRHLVGASGVCYAVDLGALINGEYRGDWPLYNKLASAVQQAAKELSIDVVWGGVWDRKLVDIGDPAAGVEAYVRRRKAMGKKKVFIDGPHFELSREKYPA